MKKHLEMSVEMIKHTQQKIENIHKGSREKIKDLQAECSANKSLILQLEAKLSSVNEYSSSTSSSSINGGFCQVIKFANFQKHKDEDNEWYSAGLYTSPAGYKFRLNVCANGSDDDYKDTHVSCYIQLMSGAYDNILEWPFQGKITVELLNQLEDKNHMKRVVQFDESTPLECRQIQVRKRHGVGYGIPDFISHSDLFLNSFLNCQYLKDDALYFRVSVTTTFKTKPWLATITRLS